MGINWSIVKSIGKRDLRRQFTNPSGYVFVTLFILLSAAAAFWQERFFLDNLANLDRLNQVFPFLLVLFIPALTMGVWADERKQGTDELLLTLPARDVEIVLGKYAAIFGVYLASLLLSSSHVLVLMWLGSPDLGLMAANYVGYALAGGALIAVAMLASLGTANATVAFILGSLLCAGITFLEPLTAVFSDNLARVAAVAGLQRWLADFARGVVGIPAIIYFAALTAFFLFLNVVAIGRRHWPQRAGSPSMAFHSVIRAAAIAVALTSVAAVVGRLGMRIDATSEKLHTLTGETREILGQVDETRPVYIQAFVSPAVPESLVQTRANLVAALGEIDAIAGARVEVLVQDTEPFTDAARTAREQFGITSQQMPSRGDSSARLQDVFLGVAVTCGASEQVIPFLDPGLPVEYELARAIRVVAHTQRKKIGVVQTAFKLFGGLDFQTFQNSPPWSVVEELKKQYEVVQISPEAPITEKVDGLLVVLPSSLSQEEMENVATAIESGTPALILDDPLPVVDISNAPSERPGANRNPFQQQGQPPPKPKGDIEAFFSRFGVAWNKAMVAWDAYNPHPELAHLPPEVVFVGAGGGNRDAFNPAEHASRGLQELVMLYPGRFDKAPESGFEVTPLLQSGTAAGSLDYARLVQRSFFGAQLVRNQPHRPDATNLWLAVKSHKAGDKPVHVIFVADVDFISEQFFTIRRVGLKTLDFDNVTFFLNAMDMVVGDESFIDLRGRRVRHRTLERVEEQTKKFVEQRTREEKEAQDEADQALEAAKQRLTAKVDEVRQRADLDEQAKLIMAKNLEEAENRRLDALKAGIEQKKEQKTQASKDNVEWQIRRIQSGIRTFAVALPPIPVFLLGVWVFIRRQRRERAGAVAARRLRS